MDVKGEYYGISDLKLWKEVMDLDYLNNCEDYFVSVYASDCYFEFKNNNFDNGLYSEDFAESLRRYFDYEDVEFRNKFPNRVKVIEYMLGLI